MNENKWGESKNKEMQKKKKKTKGNIKIWKETAFIKTALTGNSVSFWKARTPTVGSLNLQIEFL